MNNSKARGMTQLDLENVMREWGLNAAQLAKVLCLHSAKISEYLAGVRPIPCSVFYSIQALQMLEPAQRAGLIAQRLQRKPHGR